MESVGNARTGRRKALIVLAGLFLVGVCVGLYFAYYRFTKYKIQNAPLIPPDVSFYQPTGNLPALTNPDGSDVKNVILLIGDGMGPGITYMAAVVSGDPGNRLHMERMPVVGSVRTHSASSMATDSAAAATALASGFKTDDGRVAMLEDGTEVTTILEVARNKGMATGVVVTSEVTDATPAGFISHEDSRKNHDAIALDMVGNPPDILMGGGMRRWSDRDDGRDLVEEMRAKGYAVATDMDGMRRSEDRRLLGLFARGNLPDGSSLPHMTKKALSLLSAQADPEQGFFLVVEGSLIDKRAHDNDFNGVVKEMLWFDMAVSEAIAFAEASPGTLVLVTADHDTGGVTFRKRHGNIIVNWATDKHTSIPVQMFAYGPGARLFSGVLDNTDIPRRLSALLGLGMFPENLAQQ